MLCMLLKRFGCDTVARKLRIARKLVVFLNDLLWRATHFAFWPRAVKHTVYNIAGWPVVVPVIL
jgi:hypothetical protein